LCMCTLSIGDRGRGCNLGQRASLGHVHDPAGADDVPVGVAQHALVLPGQDAVSGHAQDLLHGGALQPAVVVGEGVVAGGELDGDVLLAVGVVQDGDGVLDDALVLADRVVEADGLPGVAAPLLPDASVAGADYGVDGEDGEVGGLHGVFLSRGWRAGARVGRAAWGLGGGGGGG